MLYIDNLSNSIKYLIDEETQGTYFPQNSDYMCTTGIVRETAKLTGKKIWFTKIFNPVIYLFRGFVSVVNKMFSDSYYDLEMSKELISFNVVTNSGSINKVFNK